MNRRYLAYNPALLTDAELLETFVVRQVDLQLLVETLRDNDGSSNQHVVVVGARGMGKTTLVSRVALAMNRDPDLASRWTPVLFGEESYDVGSIGELWLKALQRLAETVGGSRWKEAFEAIKEEADEERLRDRALGRLLDYARDSKTRILLVVESFDMMLSEQIEHDDAWALRHALQQHPEIMLLATAIDYANVFGQKKLPLYGFAREHRLQPLTLAETRALWTHVAKVERSERSMIPIHRLTGGNPRLVTIVASFSAGRSFRQLMYELTALVDEHTSYFKANIEALPATERRVYSTLADLWAPATSRQVAERCRMDVSKTSALLARLVKRGMVEDVGKNARVKRFQLTERLYNVYHVLRNRGGEQRPRLKGLVEFMAMFYESDDIVEIMGKLAREATELPQEDWGEYIEAYVLLLEKLPHQQDIFRVTPDAFLVRVLQAQLPWIGAPLAQELLKATASLAVAVDGFTAAPGRETAARAMAALAVSFGTDASSVMELSLRILTSEHPMLRDQFFAEFKSQFLVPVTARLWPWIDDQQRALSALEALQRAYPRDREVLVALAFGLAGVGRVDEALSHARAVTEAFPSDGKAWGLLGHVLQAKQDDEGAASAYRRALEGAAEPRFQLRLAAILQRAPEHVAEARRLADEVPFEAGELSQWLAIAKAETDPDRALRLATHLLASADLVTSLAALGVIAKASRDEAQVSSIMKETIKTRPRSPGALICILTVLTLSIQAGGAPDEHWPVFEALLRHPHWKVEPLRVGALVGPAVLRWARRDSTRILALLEGLDASVALNPVVVAMRLALGGDVSDAPAELLPVASDLVNVLTEHEST